VKVRLFRHLLEGGDAHSVELYRWTISKRSGARMAANVPTDRWKMTLDDYLASAGALAASMALRGFLPEEAIPIDPDGELLNGSHRTACALALGIESVPVERRADRVWAPAWGLDWFVANGISEDDLNQLKQDWNALCCSSAK
jgi:hypothetical protein